MRNIIHEIRIASLGYLLLREPSVLRAWFSLFRDLPRLLSQRKKIQARAKQIGINNVYRFFQ
jgi:hypothetical protein